MKRGKRAFTIIELMLVIGVISILMTIITVTASNAIESARSKRREAMQTAFQAAIASCQAADPDGRWPKDIQTAADNGQSAVLSESAAQDVFRYIVQKSCGENGKSLPLIDPHALFVAPAGAQAGRSQGLSYDEARHGDGHSRRKLGVAQLMFGYAGRSSGRFHPFNIVYHAETDSVTVHDCCERCLTVDGCRNSKCPNCRHLEER